MSEITLTVSTCAETVWLVACWDAPGNPGGITTQGKGLAELEANAKETVAVHFEGEEAPRAVRLHFVEDPVLAGS